MKTFHIDLIGDEKSRIRHIKHDKNVEIITRTDP